MTLQLVTPIVDVAKVSRAQQLEDHLAVVPELTVQDVSP